MWHGAKLWVISQNTLCIFLVLKPYIRILSYMCFLPRKLSIIAQDQKRLLQTSYSTIFFFLLLFKREQEMESQRMTMINCRNLSRRSSGRLIPKRGQVKVSIVVGLAHSVASICSPSRRWGCDDGLPQIPHLTCQCNDTVLIFFFLFPFLILYSVLCIKMNDKFSFAT